MEDMDCSVIVFESDVNDTENESENSVKQPMSSAELNLFDRYDFPVYDSEGYARTKQLQRLDVSSHHSGHVERLCDSNFSSANVLRQNNSSSHISNHNNTRSKDNCINSSWCIAKNISWHGQLTDSINIASSNCSSFNREIFSIPFRRVRFMKSNISEEATSSVMSGLNGNLLGSGRKRPNPNHPDHPHHSDHSRVSFTSPGFPRLRMTTARRCFKGDDNNERISVLSPRREGVLLDSPSSYNGWEKQDQFHESETDDDFFDWNTFATPVTAETPSSRNTIDIANQLTSAKMCLQTGDEMKILASDAEINAEINLKLRQYSVDEKENSFKLCARKNLFDISGLRSSPVRRCSASGEVITPTRPPNVPAFSPSLGAQSTPIENLRKHQSCDYPPRVIGAAPRILTKCHSETGSSSCSNAVEFFNGGHLDENWIGDFSRPFCLPLVSSGKHPDIKAISHETMARVLRNEFSESINKVVIVDCRYPYEFNGGHIVGARNLYSKESVLSEFLSASDVDGESIDTDVAADERRNIIVFHCEYSSERGPKLLRFLRNKDRDLHRSSYPMLRHPEVYLLEGGYRDFYVAHSELCEPRYYKPMNHKNHTAELVRYRSESKLYENAKSSSSSSLFSRCKLIPSISESNINYDTLECTDSDDMGRECLRSDLSRSARVRLLQLR